MNVLVVDVGGSHVKLLATGQTERRRFDSGPSLTPGMMVDRTRQYAEEWKYDVIALGIPANVGPHGVIGEPGNLAPGWVGFDFAAAFGLPVRMINDAAMQALGAYEGGRMLFLGLGTGLGSAIVAEHVVLPLELGNLPHRGCTLADRLGKRGLKRFGLDAWRETVARTCNVLKSAMGVDHVVLGGGNAKQVDPLPEGVRRGGNNDAFEGGFRLWEERVEHHDVAPSNVWRVVR